MPIEESGQRHLFLATSSRFPPADDSDHVSGVKLGGGVEVAQGMTGGVGSGVYSVDWSCESSAPAVQNLLAGYESKGMIDELREHTKGEFRRIVGTEVGP